jgi:hypothetical protein
LGRAAHAVQGGARIKRSPRYDGLWQAGANDYHVVLLGLEQRGLHPPCCWESIPMERSLASRPREKAVPGL